MLCKLIRYPGIYEPRMSPTLEKSLAVKGNASHSSAGRAAGPLWKEVSRRHSRRRCHLALVVKQSVVQILKLLVI